MSKNIILTTLLFFLVSFSQAQRFSVTSFKQDAADPSANMYAVMHFNGEYCALIKVLTNASNLSFETTPDLEKVEKKKPGEFWVYVPPGIKRIVIRKEGFIPKEYVFPANIKIKTKLTYIMELEASVQNTEEEEAQPEFVVINSTPEGASVYFKNPVNDKFEYKGITPLSSPMLEAKYEYKITKEMYVDHTGGFDLKVGSPVTENITLVPNFGVLSIATTPEINATILLNGISIGKNTPYTIDPIAVGEQKITLQKELYQNANSTINIAQGSKENINVSLKPLFGNLHIISEPESGANILLNGKSINQKTPYTYKKIPIGEYTLSVQKEMYEPASKKLSIQSGDDKTETMTMTPAFGKLNIKTTLSDAKIYIDGKQKASGTYNGRIMNGLHVLEVKKGNYYTDKQNITVEKGKTHDIKVTLKPITGLISINTKPIGAEIYLNGEKQGNSPKFLRNIQIGDYTLILKKEGCGNIEKQISVTENKTTEINETLPQGEQITINTTPTGASIYIDGNDAGITRYTGTLSYGQHQIKLINGKKTIEETINIKQNGKTNWDFNVSEFNKKNFTETKANLNIEMIAVQGGTYKMGGTEDNEKPIHNVTLNDFYIGKYEVTQKQWYAIMGTKPSNFSGCDNCPVEKVSWNDIQEFLQKLNAKTGKKYRLPTEAEWEYAARGGVDSHGLAYKYSGSNNIDDVAWYGYEKSGKKTHNVGTKQANELGIYDMSGNVWEWCSDWYDKNFYSNSPQKNPQGASSGSYRVLRGGSWYDGSRDCRVADRYSYNPGSRYGDGGFRVAF